MMKRYIYTTLLILLSGLAIFAAGERLGAKDARKTIAQIPGLEFDDKYVRIVKITPPGSGGGAIVEAEIDTAYRLEKDRDHWRVAEVQLANGRWEDVELISTAIRTEKIKRTKERIQQLSIAIKSYFDNQKYYPRADDIVALTDMLVPHYMNKLLRNDYWNNYFRYTSNGQIYRLQSSGPDGKADSGDEITLENGNFLP